MKNIEIKARSFDLSRMREDARRLGARHACDLEQTDTFFRVASGRLKLRVVRPGGAELIHYRRADEPGPRASEYERVPVQEPDSLGGILTAALGTCLEVRKKRELWLLDNVRIHLDRVEGLGDFLELEAVVDAAHPEDACHERVRFLLAGLGVADADLVPCSYADLLLSRTPPRS